jgi:hypothetical protein
MAHAAMQCPRCHAGMLSFKRGGIVLEQCAGCRGVFLGEAELSRLMETAGAGPPSGPGEVPHDTGPPGADANGTLLHSTPHGTDPHGAVLHGTPHGPGPHGPGPHGGNGCMKPPYEGRHRRL